MNDDCPVFIYALCDSDPPHAVRYVGQTRNDPKWRYYMHRSNPRNSRYKAEWFASLKAAGRKPLIRILETTVLSSACVREKYHIADQLSRGAPLLNVEHVPTNPRAAGGGHPKMDDHVWVHAHLRRPLCDALTRYAAQEKRSRSQMLALLAQAALERRGSTIPPRGEQETVAHNRRATDKGEG